MIEKQVVCKDCRQLRRSTDCLLSTMLSFFFFFHRNVLSSGIRIIYESDNEFDGTQIYTYTLSANENSPLQLKRYI